VVTPVVTPVETPVETPLETPVVTPVVTPVETPVETPLETPVETPVVTPVIFVSLTGTDTNQKSVGAALDQLSTSTGSAGETLRNLLMPLTTSQAQQTFTDLTGQIHSSATNNMFDVGGNIGEQIAGRFANLGQSSINGVGYTAALQSLNSNSSNQNYFATDLAISTAKIDSEEFGVGYTDASAAQSKIQFWGGVTGYYANTDNDGNTVGTHSSGYGVVLGGDKVIGTNTYGAAFGYGASKIQSNDNLSTMNVDSFSAALYGQRELDNDITFNGSANYTNHQIKGDRIISNINLTAQSKYTAHQLRIQGELAKRYTADHNKDVIPFVIGSFSHISTGGYIETGAGGANLVSTGRNDNNINLIVGARMEIELQEKTKLMLGAGYSHRFGDDTSDATYSFAGGGSFTTKGLKQNRHSAYLEASFEKAFSDTTTLFAKTSGNLTTGHQSIGGNVGFRVKF
jgi:outer membrane autotransporter protein